jgi:hypothetical protein
VCGSEMGAAPTIAHSSSGHLSVPFFGISSSVCLAFGALPDFFAQPWFSLCPLTG